MEFTLFWRLGGDGGGRVGRQGKADHKAQDDGSSTRRQMPVSATEKGGFGKIEKQGI